MSAGRPPEAERRAATRFLQKPFTPAELEEAIREALEKSGNGRAPPNGGHVTSLREQMLSWVSHEIKTPLSAATAAVHLATRAVRAHDEPQVEKRLDTIARQLRRMDELVTSILDAAQLEDGGLRLNAEEVDLDALLAGAVSFWRELYPDHDISSAGESGLTVKADRERLRQILDNLISNAVKYGKPAKLVAIAVTSDASSVSVSVRDRGAGIPPEELDSIFDRFHRLAGQGGRGHGLGLFIAAALARLHGGSITVESEVGAGSTFKLTIPRK
jgi:signal transduction histidine kinase